MNYLLILVSVLAFSCNSFGTRLFQTRFAKAERRLPLYQALCCLISTLCFWGAGRFGLPDLRTALYGVAFGVFFFLATAMAAKGFETGSMALTSVIMNMSLIIPVLYSIVVPPRESLTGLHILGFALFCVSVVFSAVTKGKQKKATFLWMVVVLIGFASNGLTAAIQKHYMRNTPDEGGEVFLATAYATATLCFLVICLVKKLRMSKEAPADGEQPSVAVSRKVGYSVAFLGTALLAGGGSFGGNLLMGALSNQVPGAILYPCINGGLAICTTLFSFLIFRERPTAQKICSILFGCAAIVVLNLG